LKFAKLHSLGNDFLVVNAGEAGSGGASLAELARRMCDRHRGVGADGTVFFQPTIGDREADYSVLVFNADGSKAEMSGNGVRCVAAFLKHSALHDAPVLRIRTVSGIKSLSFERCEGPAYLFRCSMGRPVTDPAKMPVLLPGNLKGPILDYPLDLGSETLAVSLSSMGNPHCSTFWPDITRAPLERMGAQLEVHGLFPQRTNVEFIQVLDLHRIRVRFWERGVGPTLCSGTGSSAASVASILKNMVASPVKVETELGFLLVEWQPGEDLFLTGPAEYICSGTYPV
jgi:diaminopimelate epimerase